MLYNINKILFFRSSTNILSIIPNYFKKYLFLLELCTKLKLTFFEGTYILIYTIKIKYLYFSPSIPEHIYQIANFFKEYLCLFELYTVLFLTRTREGISSLFFNWHYVTCPWIPCISICDKVFDIHLYHIYFP